MDDRRIARNARPHPPPNCTETRVCAPCEGEESIPIDHQYDWTTGLLTIFGGPCCFCGGTGEQVVYLYRGGGA